MAFDVNEPNDNIKIRDLPLAIRNNFEAIETGDSTFQPDQLNLAEQGGNPAAIASVFTLFGKSFGGNTELFGENPAGTIYQLTGDYSLGVTGYTYVAGGKVLIQWGNGSGTTQNFGIAFPNNVYILVVTPRVNAPVSPFYVVSKSVTGFTVSPSVNGFDYIAIGN